jgi:hypothetical protein
MEHEEISHHLRALSTSASGDHREVAQARIGMWFEISIHVSGGSTIEACAEAGVVGGISANCLHGLGRFNLQHAAANLIEPQRGLLPSTLPCYSKGRPK